MTAGKRIALIVGGIYLFLIVLAVGIFGWSRLDNEEFKPQNEFKLDPWIELGPFDINKAVLYLVIASLLTVGTMLYVSSRMQARPNKVQTAVEWIYTAMRDNITRGNMDDAMARKWFPFIATLFLFIWFSNLIGYIPLPTNTHEKVDIFGVAVPSFALYAATANLSVPLVLALVVFIAYNVEGIRAKGFGGYLKSLIPGGDRQPRHEGVRLRARVPLELHAAHLALRPSLRQHPRRPPDHPVHDRRPRRAAGDRGARRRDHPRGHRDLPLRGRAWSRRCRRSSSPPSLPSTSAARSPSTTKSKGDPPSC